MIQAAAVNAVAQNTLDEFRAGREGGHEMKHGLVIHVHGVASPKEAEQLESLGIDLIGVVVGERATGRVIARDDAHALAACLKRARLCVELLGEASLLEPQAARRMGVQVVQVPWGAEVPQTGAGRSRRPRGERPAEPVKHTRWK
ncbi:hypothetical protein ACN28S_53675 [Cystobacter fuscus]